MADVFSTLRKKRLYLLIFCFFLWMAAAGVLIPHVAPISVDFFAATKSSDGVGIACDGNVSGPAHTQGRNATLSTHQEACRAGARTAVSWVAVTAFFQNGLAFVVTPLIGWASDGLGRKPFFAASQVFAAIPAVWIVLYLHFGGARLPQRHRECCCSPASAMHACVCICAFTTVERVATANHKSCEFSCDGMSFPSSNNLSLCTHTIQAARQSAAW